MYVKTYCLCVRCGILRSVAQDADAVYTDSWMSYTISDDALDRRVALLKPFQVTEQLLSSAKRDVIFMNCLPAARGMEQTAEVCACFLI